ncbi:hypothetical protein DUT91_02785 [Phyllobacterium salinisoli]|uniref:Uncharacterized protein n=1 Tax=Phyllobacterium salinisoli TaxID=1899321 RepID=A0A368K8N0_9HYPH|nr:hypothetical protein [Phyllobacterium salinisoli]RCS25716.1 hypothetical protein DUT91_02785 [Phyllobacterium salinisoli]
MKITLSIRELTANAYSLGEFSAELDDGRLITAFDDNTIWIDGESFGLTEEWLDRKVEVSR